MRDNTFILWVAILASSARIAALDDKQADPAAGVPNVVEQRAEGSVRRDTVNGGIGHSPEDFRDFSPITTNDSLYPIIRVRLMNRFPRSQTRFP